MSNKSIESESELWNEIINWLFELDKKGVSKATEFINLFSDENTNKERVISDLFVWIKEYATQKNDALALYFVGKCYYLGDKIPRDCETGLHYLQMASKLENKDALYWLGNYYSENKDIENALKYFREAERLGHDKASRAISIIELQT